MGGQQGAPDPRAGQAAGGAQHLQLAVQIQAVAGFDLDGGDAVGHWRGSRLWA